MKKDLEALQKRLKVLQKKQSPSAPPLWQGRVLGQGLRVFIEMGVAIGLVAVIGWGVITVAKVHKIWILAFLMLGLVIGIRNVCKMVALDKEDDKR